MGCIKISASDFQLKENLVMSIFVTILSIFLQEIIIPIPCHPQITSNLFLQDRLNQII